MPETTSPAKGQPPSLSEEAAELVERLREFTERFDTALADAYEDGFHDAESGALDDPEPSGRLREYLIALAERLAVDPPLDHEQARRTSWEILSWCGLHPIRLLEHGRVVHGPWPMAHAPGPYPSTSSEGTL